MRYPLIAVVSLAASLLGSFLVVGSLGSSASASHAGGMDAMSIDMDPSAAPANTGTALGSRELGARMNENDVLDADEDGIDQAEVDITAEGIPASNPLFHFYAELNYGSPPAPGLCVDDVNYNFKIQLASNAGETTPDCDGTFFASGFELALVYQDGDGVLARLTLETQPGVVAGIYPLTLDDSAFAPGHLDPAANPHDADTVNNAFICIDTACDDVDGDGVLNVDDDCPYTPPAEPVDANGCTEANVDADGDGICDPGKVSTFCTGEDVCPDSESGEPVDANGCTLAQIDADVDGVCAPGVTSPLCSGEDACPVIFGPPENDGCPLAGPPAVGGVAGLLDAPDVDATSTDGDGASAFVAALATAGALASIVLAAGFAFALRRIR